MVALNHGNPRKVNGIKFVVKYPAVNFNKFGNDVLIIGWMIVKSAARPLEYNRVGNGRKGQI